MKALRFALFSLSLFCISLPAHSTSEGPAAKAYAQAVSEYLNAAGQQLQTIHIQVNAEEGKASDARKARYKAVYAQLDKCEALLTDLKHSSPQEFDRIKAEYEQSLHHLLATWDAVRGRNMPPE